MKHEPDQAFGHREVFCFFLANSRLGRTIPAGRTLERSAALVNAGAVGGAGEVGGAGRAQRGPGSSTTDRQIRSLRRVFARFVGSWCSLSIGGWQSGAAAPAISFLLARRRRWPRGLSSGVGFAATGLHRRGEGGRVNRLAPSRARARQRRATGQIRPELWVAPAISFLWNDRRVPLLGRLAPVEKGRPLATTKGYRNSSFRTKLDTRQSSQKGLPQSAAMNAFETAHAGKL